VTNLHAEDALHYPVSVLCNLFGVSKQAYYKHNEDALMAKAAKEEFVVQFIRETRQKDGGIGGRKLWYMYKQRFGETDAVGRDTFETIIDRNGLKVRKKMRKPKTTDSSHGLPTFPNLVGDLIPMTPNQLWVSDITYIDIWLNDTTYMFCYLSLILDAYTEEIVGWSVGPTLETAYPIKALNMALERIDGQSTHNLIHHSDRGCQYASREYVNILRSHGVQISMTESGDPKDNAQAERVNNTMKNELLRGKRFSNIREVEQSVKAAVDFYNNERPHMSIDMLTPVEAAQKTGEIPMRWKSFRQEYIKNSQKACVIP